MTARRRRTRLTWGLRLALVLAGLYLIALPLVFTVFAKETGTGHHFARRLGLTALWFVCALIGGVFAARRDARIEALGSRLDELVPSRRVRADRRELAALNSIRALLAPGFTGLPDAFRFQAFIPTQRGLVIPLLEPQPQAWQQWPAGCGIVGLAWANPDAFVEGLGAELVDPDLGLTPAQREHYGHLEYVGAAVVRDVRDEPVGVLAVSSAESVDFAAAGGAEAFRRLSSDIGVLVGDARGSR